jgi:hypothetical protein
MLVFSFQSSSGLSEECSSNWPTPERSLTPCYPVWDSVSRRASDAGQYPSDTDTQATRSDWGWRVLLGYVTRSHV